MNRTTKLLITAMLLIAGLSISAQQQECATICHNGTLVKAIGSNAIDGHLNNHSEDILISTDCEYEIQGNECSTLSLPKLNIKQQIPIGIKYYITDISGRLIKVGVTNENFKKDLPIKGVYIIGLEGYRPKKIYINN